MPFWLRSIIIGFEAKLPTFLIEDNPNSMFFCLLLLFVCMENEVKLTVIATGFPKQEDLDQIDRETTFEAMHNPEAVKIPPFLRKHPSAIRRIRGGMSKTMQLGLEIN